MTDTIVVERGMSARLARRLITLVLLFGFAPLLMVLWQIHKNKYGDELIDRAEAIVWATVALLPLVVLLIANRFKRRAPASRGGVAHFFALVLGFALIAGQCLVLYWQPKSGIDIFALLDTSFFVVVPVALAVSVFAFRIAGPFSDKSSSEAVDQDVPSQLLRGSRNGFTIVFIHGILSGKQAWRNPKTGAVWPNLVLEDDELTEYGVYVFNYRADAFSGSYSIEEAANKLWEDIADRFPSERGFVFVGHSMGGIVARNYVVNRLVDLLKAKRKIGVILVASPSAGSIYANIVTFLSPFYNSQLKTLRTGQTNEWLASVDQRFVNAVHQKHVDISGKELIEDNAPTFLRALLQRAQIVPPVSAAKYFPDHLRIEHSDHGSIAKPASQTAGQHRALRRFLREFLQDKTIASSQPVGHAPAVSNPRATSVRRKGPIRV